jgi:hypothetical protein
VKNNGKHGKDGSSDQLASQVCCGCVCFRVGQIGLTDSRSKMPLLDSAKHFQLNSIKEEVQRAVRRRDENVTVISDTSGQCSLVFLSRFSTKLIMQMS